MKLPFILTISVLFFALMLNTLRAAEDLPIRETFKSGQMPAGWKVVAGAWEVSGKALQAKPEGGKPAIFSFDQELRDARALVDFSLESIDAKSWVGIIMRDGAGEGPAVRLAVHFRSKDTLLEIAMRDKAAPDGWRVFANGRHPQPLATGKHRAALELAGPWISGSIDGKRVVQIPRAAELAPAGKLSLVVAGKPWTITGINVQPPAARKVEPPLVSAPLIIAHRGFSSLAPENTLVAYRKAIEVGAEMAECDTYLTKDGVPILLHDRTLKRTTGTDAPPRALTLEEIQKLDAGKWKDPEYAGERVPTLKELMTLVKGKLRLVIEIKEHEIEEPVLKVIHESGVPLEELMIFSFYYDVVEKMAKLEPLLPTTWLVGDLPYDRAGRHEVIRQALAARCSAVGLPYERAEPTFLRSAHKAGLQVFVWTVDEPADMKYLLRIGADAIITNKPDVLKKVLSVED